jgi:hypothetical protein
MLRQVRSILTAVGHIARTNSTVRRNRTRSLAAIVGLVAIAAFAASSKAATGADGGAGGHADAGNLDAAAVNAPYQMTVDADPDAAEVQAARVVSGSAPFQIGIDITRIGAEPYSLLQWEVAIRTDQLAFDENRYVNTNVTGFIACMRQDSVNPRNGETVIAAGCTGQTPDTTSTFVGEIADLSLRCLAEGTFEVRLVDLASDPFGSSLFGTSLAPLQTGTAGARVTCSNVGSAPAPTHAAPVAAATPRSDGPTRLSLDADREEPGVQSQRHVSGTAPFSIDLVVTTLGSVGYVGYQWEAQFADEDFALISNSIVEHSDDTDFTLCQRPNVNPGPTVILESSCARMSLMPSDYLGPTSSFQIRCLRVGVHRVELADLAGDEIFGSTLLDRTAATIQTSTTGVTINCTGVAD